MLKFAKDRLINKKVGFWHIIQAGIENLCFY